MSVDAVLTVALAAFLLFFGLCLLGLVVVTVVVSARERSRARIRRRMGDLLIEVSDGEDPPLPATRRERQALAAVAIQLATSLRGGDREALAEWMRRNGYRARASAWMRSTNPALRLRGITLATLLGDDRARATITRMLADDHRRVRVGAARALGVAGDLSALDALWAAVAEGRIPASVGAMSVLRLFPRTAEELATGFASNSSDVRRVCAEVAGHLDLLDARPRLERLVEDPVAAVRMAAIGALVRLDDPLCLPALQQHRTSGVQDSVELGELDRAIDRLRAETGQMR